MNLNEFKNDKVTINIAGENVEVNATDPVKESLKRILEEKGIDSFTILVNGAELQDTAGLPETFGQHKVEVKRYVKPGC